MLPEPPTAWRLVEVALDKESAALTFSLNRQKLRIARRRKGRYLLRTNPTDKDQRHFIGIGAIRPPCVQTAFRPRSRWYGLPVVRSNISP